MRTLRVCLLAIAAVCLAMLSAPRIARADDLTGSVGISWIYGTSTLYTDTIPAGSSLSCPGSSPICTGYAGYGVQTFTVGSSSFSYSSSDYPGSNYSGTVNGFELTGVDFASGDPFTITVPANSMGLTSSDITVLSPSSIFINLAGLPVDSSFTVDFIPTTPVAAPEPSSLAMLGIGLLGLAVFARKRIAAGRFAVESAN